MGNSQSVNNKKEEKDIKMEKAILSHLKASSSAAKAKFVNINFNTFTMNHSKQSLAVTNNEICKR